MIIKAKYKGTCHTCGGDVLPGSDLHYEEGNNYTDHLLCTEEGRKAAEHLRLSVEASHARISSHSFLKPKGLDYLPFQKAGIHYALTRQTGTLIADEMGLGKTIQALGVINELQPKKVLIVCPASLKFNWKNESKTWLVGNPDIQVGSDLLFDPDASIHVQITNYERLGELPGNTKPDLFILDEAHYVKSREAERTQKATYLAKRSGKILALSGTPIPNAPEDLWPLLRMLNPDYWPDRIAFVRRYCAAHEAFRTVGKGATRRLVRYLDTKGASNLEELQEILRSTVMIRRLKKDVLQELPDKIQSILTLPSTKVQELINEEKKTFDKYGFTEETTVEEMRMSRVAFEEISAARKKLGLAKVPLIIEHIRTCFYENSEKKIILFAHHGDVISKLYDGLCDFSPAIIRGSTPEEERGSIVKRFQENPRCRLFLGSIGAAGVGITLTASSHVVFGEVSWSPKEMAQAWDRAHRIGQKESVLVQLLVYDESLDANIMKRLVKKMKVAGKALD